MCLCVCVIVCVLPKWVTAAHDEFCLKGNVWFGTTLSMNPEPSGVSKQENHRFFWKTSRSAILRDARVKAR